MKKMKTTKGTLLLQSVELQELSPIALYIVEITEPYEKTYKLLTGIKLKIFLHTIKPLNLKMRFFLIADEEERIPENQKNE